MKGTSMDQLTKKPLFNPQGDTSLNARRMIGGNTTNLNDLTICVMPGQGLVPSGHE